MSLSPRIDRLERNTLINGNFDFWQRGTSFSLTPSGSSRFYAADRWCFSNFFASGSATISRSTNIPTSTSAIYSMLTTVSSTISVAGGNYFFNAGCQRIEGFNMQNAWGKTYTLTFWVKASLTGAFPVVLGSQYDAVGTHYLSSYTINTANTWEQKTITVTIPAFSAPFVNDNTEGFYVAFPIAVSATGNRIGTTLNTWTPSNSFQVTSALNRTDMLTAGNNISFAQVSFTQASSATTNFTRSGIGYADELRACQRYFEKSYLLADAPGALTTTSCSTFSGNGGGNRPYHSVYFKVMKRLGPSGQFYNPRTGGTGAPIWDINTANTDYGIVAAGSSENSFFLAPSGTPPVSSALLFHWIMDAEL